MSGAIKWGTEFRINTITADEQDHPAITALADGRFVAAWESDDSIHVQRFAASGSKVGAEVVAISNLWDGSDPAVTELADGGFVVSYTSYNETYGDIDGGVWYQPFDASGAETGPELHTSITRSGVQADTAITTLSNGRYVVTWQDNSSGDANIRAQMFDSDTNAKVGGELLVNTTLALEQLHPAMTALDNGQFIIAWAHIAGIPGIFGDAEIRAQIFDANGGKSGGEFLVSTAFEDWHDLPTITALSNGNFLATWDDQDNWDIAVAAQLFDSNGGMIGTPFDVSATPAWEQTNAATGALDNGRFVVAWQHYDIDGTDIRAQVFNTDGSKSGDEFVVNTIVGADQIDPTVTVLADGRFVVGWTDDSNSPDDPADTAVRGQIFDARESGINLTGDALKNDWVGSDFDDVMHSGESNDQIKGGGGHDILDGGNGYDIMAGGTGDDWYFVDHVWDAVFESPGQGALDRVFTNSNYTLTPGAEIEIFSTTDHGGLGGINLTGNELANTIFGNAGDNDLDGAAGADTMVGGGGNDDYYVDNADDLVIEPVTGAAGGGDRVYTSVSYALKAGNDVEILAVANAAGVEPINLTGNEFYGSLYGNLGPNILNGKGGVDAMTGYGGDDYYFVDNAFDSIKEIVGGGADQVFASVDYALNVEAFVETLSTTSTPGLANLNLTGNERDNTVIGNAGSNALKGLAGNDVLFGGGGIDAFAFNTALNAVTNVDTILDFNVADDDIALGTGIFTGLAAGVLSAAAFVTGAAAADASDRIVYNSASGALYFDPDGIGGAAQIQFASVTAGLALTNADFLVM